MGSMRCLQKLNEYSSWQLHDQGLISNFLLLQYSICFQFSRMLTYDAHLSQPLRWGEQKKISQFVVCESMCGGRAAGFFLALTVFGAGAFLSSSLKSCGLLCTTASKSSAFFILPSELQFLLIFSLKKENKFCSHHNKDSCLFKIQL